MSAASARERMIQLYADGYSLQEVAGRLGCTREWVRQNLAAAGVARRPNGYAPKLGDLAQEIFSDLEDQFPNGATLGQLREWLGETATDLRRALGELIAAGWVTVKGARYLAHTAAKPLMEAPPKRPPPPRREFPCAAPYGSRSLGVLHALERAPKGLRELAAELDHEAAHLRGVLAGLHHRGFIREAGRDRSVQWRANLWIITPAGIAHAAMHSERAAA